MSKFKLAPNTCLEINVCLFQLSFGPDKCRLNP